MDPEARFSVASLRDAFIFANTPAYLFKRFRGDASVQEIGMECTEDEIDSMLKRLRPSANADVYEVIRFYAALIALTFRDSDKADALLEAWADSGIHWVPELVGYYHDLPHSEDVSVSMPAYATPFATRDTATAEVSAINVNIPAWEMEGSATCLQ